MVGLPQLWIDLLRFFFFFGWCNCTFNYAQEEWTKFGDMIERKIQKFIIIPIFLQFVGTHCLNRMNFTKTFSKSSGHGTFFLQKSIGVFLYCCYCNVKIPPLPSPPQRFHHTNFLFVKDNDHGMFGSCPNR